MKTIVAILSAALIALSGGLILLWRQLDASRHEVAALQAQIDSTAASANQAATSSSSPSLPLAGPTPAAPTAAPAQDTDTDRQRKVAEEVERLQAMLRVPRGPERAAQAKTRAIGTMPIEYPDVGQALGLSRDEVDQLFDLLYEQDQRPPGNDPASAARNAQTAKDELVSLLGSRYATWEEYKAELPTRQHMKNLTVVLDAGGTPLSDAQNKSLLQSLVAAEARNREFYEATHKIPSDGQSMARYYRFTPEANRNLLNAASAYLTPQQMEAYKQMLERASAQEAATRSWFIKE